MLLVVIMSTITAYGLTEEWFMLFWLAVLSNIAVLGLTVSGSCCGYSFYHYCSRFDRGVVHVVVVILSTIAV